MTHSWGPRSNNSNSFVPFSEDETSRGSLDLSIFGMPRDGIISMGELVQAQPDDGILHTACSGSGALLSTQDNEATVWALHDQLCQKAATLAQLYGHKNMEYFCLSDAALKVGH